MCDIIRAENISISYHNGNTQNFVIKDLSFSIPKNSVFGIVGRSGIGKTSLLRAIFCDTASNFDVKGSFFYNNTQYYSSNCVLTTVLRDFFYVPQLTASAISPLHTLGQVFSDLYLSRLSKTQKVIVKKCYSDELNKLDLPENVLDCYSYELSGGMLQRALLGMGFAIAPPVLILDEPTSALDWGSQLKVTERIIEAKEQQHLTIVVVSHDKNFLESICTHILFFEPSDDERQVFICCQKNV